MMVFALLGMHAAATLFMTGLIWFVQVVHYPLMARVGSRQFPVYEADHARRTTWVVGPMMLLEAVTAFLLVISPEVSMPLAGMGLGLLVLIWLSTAFLQVPAHRFLETGFDPAAHGQLVRSNWLRTAAWTLRSVLALGLLAAA